ncbi:hypothetical protein [Burkholderia sp. 22PA0106]|uniref:hypothetical protein n=1 Tax=Burkholderia sp. 22PA0106 TaxID=3237371 RepID=UPI0039C16EF0
MIEKKPAFLLEAERKLKSIGDFIKKFGGGKLKFTVEVYRNEKDEPLVVVMEASRHKSGEFNIRHKPIKRIGPLDSNVDLLEKLKLLKRPSKLTFHKILSTKIG